ncbi:hypothetical protein J3R83DRAFT_4437 [Lanmaoa asiatica]|nr:hypothetical protein J3R83DRAFT_4437 [Lanmaoa asiatica]
MIFIVTRTSDWASAKEPLVRHLRPAKSSQSTIMDALDLASALRGYGWNWSGGVYIPRETRPTSRGRFTFYVILSAAVHALSCNVLQRAIVSFSPMSLRSLSGGSIFDETLPFYVRYPRASVITVLVGFAIYAFIQVCYDTCTLVAVLVFGQEPAQWPPAFDAPWRATSLSDFWGRRWHQFFRRIFLTQGGYPLSLFFGRAGVVIGTFLSSAIMHHIAMVALNDQLEPWRMLAGFGMMAPVVLAEGVFMQLTGRKLAGCAGWVWTMAWLLLWGNLIVDGFARGGLFGHLNFTEGMPGKAVVERLVANFDSWLHAM